MNMFEDELSSQPRTKGLLPLATWLQNELFPRILEFETTQHIPKSFFKSCGKYQWLGANIPSQYGGLGLDYQQLGSFHAALGSVYGSFENALTVAGMVSKPILGFGTTYQKQTWLPQIASGSIIPAIALTEPSGGSDLASIACHAAQSDKHWYINGCKTYITLGQIADLFLLLATTKDGFTAFLVPANCPGLTIEPIEGLLGLRGNMLAKLTFEHCRLGREHQLGKMGMGLNPVVNTALDEGRFSTAWGAIGLGQACLRATREHVYRRRSQGKMLAEQPLVLGMLSTMIVDMKAAMGLGKQAAVARDEHAISYLHDTLIAKYHSARMAVSLANAAVQLHGAMGVTRNHAVARYYRDAKMFELIEGSNTLYETMIAQLYMPDMEGEYGAS